MGKRRNEMSMVDGMQGVRTSWSNVQYIVSAERWGVVWVREMEGEGDAGEMLVVVVSMRSNSPRMFGSE